MFSSLESFWSLTTPEHLELQSVLIWKHNFCWRNQPLQIRSSKLEICWSEGGLEAGSGLMYDACPHCKHNSVLEKAAFMVKRVAWDLKDLHAVLDCAPAS